MENYFATKFEDIRHERSLIISVLLTDADVRTKQTNITQFR